MEFKEEALKPSDEIGLNGIPQKWLCVLKQREWIEEMCEHTAESWGNI